MVSDRPKLPVRTRRPLLTTESAADFEALRTRFTDDVNPRDAIERMHCDDIVNLVWEIMRLRRAKVALLNLALRDALFEILVEKLHEFERGQKTLATLAKWSTDEEIRENVANVLVKHRLDESIIEAEAFRCCSVDMMRIEQLLASAELRRDKALHAIALYRESLAEQLCYEATQVMHDEGVARIEFKKSSDGQR